MMRAEKKEILEAISRALKAANNPSATYARKVLCRARRKKAI